MTQLLQNAAYGTAMILAVALLRRVLKDRLAPGARLALWAVCLFRLLTPAAPESVLSLWGLPRLFGAQRQAVPVSSAPAYVPAPGTAPQAAPRPGPGISWETLLLAAWLAVGVAAAARYAVIWIRTRRAVACAVPLDRADPRYVPLPRCARLREGPMEGAPLTFGVARPTVVLSPGLDGAELDCVLAHEGVHAARRDNLWHYAMALALAVHWWNPAVWLMSRLLRRDVELSCDRAAVKKLGANRRADYANALVSLAAQKPGPAFCQTFGQKAAEERILSIMKFKKTSMIGVIFTLALVLAVSVAFASEPKEPRDDTVVFHGQTFSRSELSQETLDWLDWYLALPGEEQLAVNSVPADLHRGGTPEVYDAYEDSAANSSSVFPTGDPTLPSYVETDDPLLNEPLEILEGEGNISYDVNGYEEVKLPEFDEDGNPVNNGIIGSRFYSYELITDPDTVSGGEVFKAYQLCDAADCGITGHHYHAQGQVIYVDSQAPNAAPSPAPSAGPAPTTASSASPDPTTAPSAGPAPTTASSASPDPIAAQPLVSTAPVPACGFEGCVEARYHRHLNGQCVLLDAPCTVGGCTAQGNHFHNGVCYSCNGSHSGGVCDGSCYGHSNSNTASAGSHHRESHHGRGHHGGHH